MGRQALYGTEVLSYSARAKGLAFQNVVTQASSCINTFACVSSASSVHDLLTNGVRRLPIALEKIGWKGTFILSLRSVVDPRLTMIAQCI